MLQHRPRIVFVGVAWLLAACQGDHGADPLTDAGSATNNGLLFNFDAATPVCRESGAPVVATNQNDASTCQPSRIVSYADDVVPIFGKNCSGEVCHSGAWGGSGAHRTLVDVPARECCDGRKLVRPGDPGESYVIQKLRGTDLCNGGKMPLDRTIDARDIATIEDWICEGAPGP